MKKFLVIKLIGLLASTISTLIVYYGSVEPYGVKFLYVFVFFNLYYDICFYHLMKKLDLE